MKRMTGGKTKKVSFTLNAPLSNHVSVAGDFNGWDRSAHPMKKDKKGVWKLSTNLTPGTYQYRFFVDGEWQNDPECTESVANAFGTFNCVRRVE